ncbi:class I SAM-dependent methyltransferase, partial [Candidatus Microgenomates bacterium]|nr:class I SAM-dependent methyltransferase [Candidatus Microgenomates bacterium]
MQKHYYALRYQVDKDEWRARAKRALIFQLWDKFHPQAGKRYRMLDFGCGSGLFIHEFEKKYPAADGFGIDIAQDAINFCKKRGLSRVYKFSGRHIPFPAGKFDLVT